jgi:hypothetical protein
MLTVTTGIIFLLFTCKHIWVWAIYDGGPRVSRPPVKWSEIAESLSNTAYRNRQPTFANYIGHSGFMLNVRPFKFLDLYLFSLCFDKLGEPGSSVSIVLATGWSTGRSRFDPRQGQRIFPLTSVSRPVLGPTQTPVQWVPGVLSPGIKRGRGVTLTTHPHLVPRSRMSRSYTSSPQAPSWRVVGQL